MNTQRQQMQLPTTRNGGPRGRGHEN
jgi:hypothetical protein